MADISHKISVVIPIRNAAQYIEETLESVVSQNYKTREIIVIDGHSNDGTVEIVKRYAKWIDCFVSEPDSGQTEAINKGVARATGEFINWLNGDDVMCPGALCGIAAELRPGVKWIAGRIEHFIEGDDSIPVWNERTAIMETSGKTAAYEMNRQPGTYFHRSLAQRFFPLNEQLHFVMDQELWIKALLCEGQSGFVASETLVCRFRRHAESKSVSNGGDYMMHLSRPFFDEYARIYASLAIIGGNHRLADLLCDAKADKDPVILSLLEGFRALQPRKELVDEVLGWFAYHMACEFDRLGEFQKVGELRRVCPALERIVGHKRIGALRWRQAFGPLLSARRAVRDWIAEPHKIV